MTGLSAVTLPPSPRRLSHSETPSPRKCATSPYFADTESAEYERKVRLQLKQFKGLELTLDKFVAKLNGIMKTNLLRTVLLPFLRLVPALDTLFAPALSIYVSLVSVCTTILGRWWRLLLSALTAPTTVPQVSLTDRNAYLECVSRILCRSDWFLAGSDAMAMYTSCLCDTLDYAINKISTTKIVPVSLSAFTGKTFAFAYFFVPGVALALLFLLNVRQSTLKSSLAHRPALPADTVATAKAVFPDHLAGLIDYRGVQSVERAKQKSINCLSPPKHPVRGICEPNGPWVRSWCCCGSDIFNAFFRHYITVCSVFVQDRIDVPVDAFPGFHVVVGNLHQVFSFCINKILVKTAANGSWNKLSVGKAERIPADAPSAGSNAVLRTTDANYALLIKVFRTIRDIGYCEVHFAAEVVKAVDRVMVTLASSTSVYDFGRTAAVLNLVCEYANHVADTADIDWEFWLGCTYLALSKTSLVPCVTVSLAFLFNVWAMIPIRLSENFDWRTQVYRAGWLTNRSESYKENFARWLTSNDTWHVFFTHWSPLVRAYYMRLIAWRVIGFNNYESSVSILTTHRIKCKVEVIYSLLERVVRVSDLAPPFSVHGVDFFPDMPKVDRKLCIVPLNTYRAMSDNGPLVAFPSAVQFGDLYEILDEAVYTCNLMSTQTPAEVTDDLRCKSSRNHSLISSFSKFFKLLSADDSVDSLVALAPPRSNAKNTFAHVRRTQSSNSFLRALPLRRSYSSPSLQFVQHSHTDTLGESPATSDSDSASTISSYFGSSSASTSSSDTSSNSHPPELVKRMPSIVRPNHKFDMVLDNEVIARKAAQMHCANLRADSEFYDRSAEGAAGRSMPGVPSIPSTLIFVNSDRYRRFYVIKEPLEFDDAVVEDERAPSVHDMFRSLKTPADLAKLGRALNEWNRIVDEFEAYLTRIVEPGDTCLASPADAGLDVDEEDYYKRIVPFMPIDNFIELKLPVQCSCSIR